MFIIDEEIHSNKNVHIYIGYIQPKTTHVNANKNVGDSLRG